MKGTRDTDGVSALPAAAEAGHNLTVLLGIVLLALLQRDELRLTDPGPYDQPYPPQLNIAATAPHSPGPI
jgi:hypothetical protein